MTGVRSSESAVSRRPSEIVVLVAGSWLIASPPSTLCPLTISPETTAKDPTTQWRFEHLVVHQLRRSVAPSNTNNTIPTVCAPTWSLLVLSSLTLSCVRQGTKFFPNFQTQEYTPN